MSNIPEKLFGYHEISLKHSDGRLLAAKVELGCQDWFKEGERHTKCRIKLTWDGGQVERAGTHFFQAFKRVREQLATRDLLPMCYGASRKIIISGMAADMGLGLKVYKAEIGNMIKREQLVSIFSCDADVEPVPVHLQEEFQYEYWQSINRQKL